MRGDRFRYRLPKFVGEIPEMADLLIAEDKEFDRIESEAELLYDDAFIATMRSEKAIRRAEEMVGIIADPSESLLARRQAVMARLKRLGPTTERAICLALLSLGVKIPKVERRDEDYAFFVYVGMDSVDLFREKGAAVVDSMKPAHLTRGVGVHDASDILITTAFMHHHFRPKHAGEIVCGEYPYESTRPAEIIDTIEIGETLDPSANRVQFAGESATNELALHGYNELNEDLNVLVDEGTATEIPDTILDGGDNGAEN